MDCWNGSVPSVQGFIDISTYTFPVLRLGQTIQSLYGIFYDNYIVIDADGIIRYTSVNEPYQGGNAPGRFHDAHLRQALTAEVTAAGDPSFESGLRITSPVRAGAAVTLRLDLPAAPGTRLEWFDSRGRERGQIPTPAAAGWQVAAWRASGRNGEPLATGVYFVRLRNSSGKHTTAKFVVVAR